VKTPRKRLAMATKWQPSL